MDDLGRWVSIPEFSGGNVEIFLGISRRFQKGRPYSTNVPILQTLLRTLLAYERLWLQSFGGAKLRFDLK
jgi:hypothetical protein